MPTRRALLAGLAVLPATAAAAKTVADDDGFREAAPAELPSARVTRLARQLADALDELNAAALAGGEATDAGEIVGIWAAEVWPARLSRNVTLVQKDVPAALARFGRRA